MSHSLVPAQELSVVLRVSNSNGRSTHRDLPVAVTVPVVASPLAIRAEPRQLRVRDAAPGVCRVVVGNSGTNRWAQVRLSATDPEQVVRTTWTSPQLQVPPGGEESTQVRFDAPPPDPGGEITRTVTLTVHEGHRTAETAVTLTQVASHPAIDLLELRLEPSVLRLGGRRRGRLTAVVDNRRGTTPVGVSLTGQDPEKSLGFKIAPGSLQVGPGQAASAQVTVTAPHTPPGQEVVRALTISATDGRADTSVEGRVIQLASSRRGIARIVLTVLGGLLMLLGSIAHSRGGHQRNSAFDLTAATHHGRDSREALVVGLPGAPAGGRHAEHRLHRAVPRGPCRAHGLRPDRHLREADQGLRRAGPDRRRGHVRGFTRRPPTASGPAAGAFVAGLGCIVAYAGGLLARR